MGLNNCPVIFILYVVRQASERWPRSKMVHIFHYGMMDGELLGLNVRIIIFLFPD